METLCGSSSAQRPTYHNLVDFHCLVVGYLISHSKTFTVSNCCQVGALDDRPELVFVDRVNRRWIVE